MTLNLRERIVLERITSVEDLNSNDRSAVDEDRDLQRLIEENARLAGCRCTYPEAPDRTSMLETIRPGIYETMEKESKPMYFIQTIFAGKRWHLQVAVAFLLVVALAGAATVMTGEKSYAETNGVVLEVDLGTVPMDAEGGCDNEALNRILKDIQANITAWQEANKGTDDGAVSQKKIIAAVKVENNHAVMRIGLINEDSTKIESLKKILEDKGYAVMAINDATWFDCCDKDANMNGLTININDHVFSFPISASKEEIEKTINDWLAVNEPEMKAEVEVTVVEKDGEKHVEVSVRIKKDKDE